MTVGAMDNGFIIHVGEWYAGYIAYSVLGAAKHIEAGGVTLFNLIRECAINPIKVREILPKLKFARRICTLNYLDLYGNPYFPVPEGSKIKLREGRHGTVWGLWLGFQPMD